MNTKCRQVRFGATYSLDTNEGTSVDRKLKPLSVSVSTNNRIWACLKKPRYGIWPISLLVFTSVTVGEMNIVLRDVELGVPIEHALRRFGDRCDDEVVRSLTTSVKEAQRFGSSLSRSLRMHAETLKTQRENQAEELAHKAAVKILFPTLLLIFPAVFIVLAGPAAIQIQEAFSK